MEEELLIETPPTPGPFFRFADENAWLTAARAAGFMTTVTDEEGNETEQLKAYTHNYAIDVIGTITRGGEWDDEGNVITPPETLDGWHLNYQGELPEGWEEFAVYPAAPVRVWA
jgi:hypothetical protein